MHLDTWLPRYDVRERHRVFVRASAARAWQAILAMDLEEVPLVKALVRAREWVVGANAVERRGEGGFFEKMAGMGWGPLWREDGRGAVMGAVTKPWEANVVFVPLAPERFATFAEDGWVVIVWGIEVAEREGGCEVATETRTWETDEETRKRFRRYWAWIWPGVKLIRWALLWEVRRRAESHDR